MEGGSPAVAHRLLPGPGDGSRSSLVGALRRVRGQAMRVLRYGILIGSFVALSAAQAAENQSWAIKADYIEACSCHLFCSCYFNTEPEGAHHCEFNNAIKISQGHV